MEFKYQQEYSFKLSEKASKSAILSLSRQIVILVPALIILGTLFGIRGYYFAGPVADGLSFIIAVTFYNFWIKESRKNNT